LSSLTFIGLIIGALTYLLLQTDLLAIDMGWCALVGFPGVETIGALLLLLLFTLQGMKYLYQGALEVRSPDGRGIADRHRLGYGFALLIGATAFLLFWLFSILSAPGWEFGGDVLYELGLVAGDAGVYFSFACISGGAFLVLYGAGTGMMHRGYMRNISGFFMTVMGIGLILEGIVLMVAGGEMFLLAEQFIIGLGAMALMCITAADWRSRHMVTAAFYLLVLVCGVAALLFFGYEVASTLSVLAFFSVLLVEGVRLLSNAN
jgi:hypothetical protein